MKLLRWVKEHGAAALILGPLAVGHAVGFFFCAVQLGLGEMSLHQMSASLQLLSLVISALLYPAVLTVAQLAGLYRAATDPTPLLPGTDRARFYDAADWLTLLLGLPLTLLYADFTEIVWGAAWYEQLYNSQLHPPIWPEAWPTVAALCAVGVLGWGALKYSPPERTPPLLSVAYIAAMYLGMSQAALFIVQLLAPAPPELLSAGASGTWGKLPLLVLPANWLFLCCRLLLERIGRWNAQPEHDPGCFRGPALVACGNRLLSNARLWPVAALLATAPLLGAVLGLLALFGQQPDRLVRAWTETAQWTLSARTAPQNAFYDEHYLCTVAAGGHEGLVKPLRMGERRGRRIVVNRQLLIANAFEELLQERSPRFHRAVRAFYDAHGYPLSRHIRTKGAADAVYILMKPLEWCFLLTLYLFDPAPETRIARQYLPAR